MDTAGHSMLFQRPLWAVPRLQPRGCLRQTTSAVYDKSSRYTVTFAPFPLLVCAQHQVCASGSTADLRSPEKFNKVAVLKPWMQATSLPPICLLTPWLHPSGLGACPRPPLGCAFSTSRRRAKRKQPQVRWLQSDLSRPRTLAAPADAVRASVPVTGTKGDRRVWADGRQPKPQASPRCRQSYIRSVFHDPLDGCVPARARNVPQIPAHADLLLPWKYGTALQGSKMQRQPARLSCLNRLL